MDKIVSLDISSSPFQAVVVNGDLDNPEVLEALEIEGKLSEEGAEGFEGFQELLEKHAGDLISTVLVVSPESYLSLNLDLPFNSPKLVEKIIDLEVQDQIPFDVNKFLINHAIIKELPEGGHDVHAAMLPRDYVEHLLSLFKEINFDPEFLTTPSAALGGTRVWPKSKENQLVVASVDNCIYTCSVLGGKVRNAQILELEHHEGFPLAALKMLCLDVEKRYEQSLEQVMLLGNSITPADLEEGLGIKVIQGVDDGLSTDLQKNIIASLAASSVIDTGSDDLLSNFRVKDFAYRPFGRTAKLLGKKLWIYLGVLLIALLLIPATVYFWRSQEIDRINESVRISIHQAVPQIVAPAGQSLDYLMSASIGIERQLEDLGTATRYNPLEVFLALNRLLADSRRAQLDLDLAEIDIKGDVVEVEGQVDSYKAVDKLQRILKREKKLFCSVKAETSGGRSASKKFKFLLRLC